MKKGILTSLDCVRHLRFRAKQSHIIAKLEIDLYAAAVTVKNNPSETSKFGKLLTQI